VVLGIKIGEIGGKLGMNSTNNGFLAFNNVRIPRMNMLMKNAQVLKVKYLYILVRLIDPLICTLCINILYLTKK